MKKVFLIFLLLFCSLGFAQQFTRYYTHTAIKFPDRDKEFVFYSSKAAVSFNVSDNNLIIVYTPKQNLTLTPVGNIRSTEEYEEITVRDPEGNRGTVTLFKNQEYGCLIDFPDIQIGFVNL